MSKKKLAVVRNEQGFDPKRVMDFANHQGSGRSWYSIQNKAGDEADVMIYDVVGWDTTAKGFVSDLKSITAKKINLHLNTPGGDVFEGVAIYNALKDHAAEVVVTIDGLAASIGSIIAMAGDRVVMAKNAYLMIHDPSGLAFGNADDMRKTADLLDKIKGTLAQTYADRTGATVDAMGTAMANETWYTAEEAKTAGFIDEISGAELGDASSPQNRVAAFLNMGVFGQMPQALRDRLTAQVTAGANLHPAETSKQEIDPMTITDFKAFAAANPQATDEFVAKGRTEGAQQTKDSFAQIVAACPGRPQLAVDCFTKGFSADVAKTMAENLEAQEKGSKAQIEAKDKEIAKLQSITNSAKPVGFVPESDKTDDAAPVVNQSPEAKAKAEWAKNEAKLKGEGFRSEKAYVAWFVNNAKGKIAVAGGK